jgi:hypothetical protein
MADKLEEIFGKKEEVKPEVQPSGGKTPEQQKVDDEAKKKEEHLVNLNKAIEDANKTLKEKRKQIKGEVKDDEEELPKIDMNDPSSKAWDKHIRDNVNPLQAELEKEKQEIRTFAIKRFLEDKPNLVSNPEALKKVIETYDKIKTASERTVEGVLIDLERANAAENYEELQAGQRIISKAKAEGGFVDIAISRGGGTSYPSPKDTDNITIKEDELPFILKTYGSVEEYKKMKKKYSQQ